VTDLATRSGVAGSDVDEEEPDLELREFGEGAVGPLHEHPKMAAHNVIAWSALHGEATSPFRQELGAMDEALRKKCARYEIHYEFRYPQV
jgi:hypothetical protein